MQGRVCSLVQTAWAAHGVPMQQVPVAQPSGLAARLSQPRPWPAAASTLPCAPRRGTHRRQRELVKHRLVGAAPNKVAVEGAVHQLAADHAGQQAVKQRASLREGGEGGWRGGWGAQESAG